MMTKVFVLHHEYQWCGRDEVKLIGIYATEAEAAEAAKRLRKEPGFCDWPDGFSIDPYSLGVDHWTEGFVTQVAVLVPPKLESGEFQTCHAVWRPGDLYKLGEIDEPEKALFSKNDVVRAEERLVPGFEEPSLVATQRVR